MLRRWLAADLRWLLVSGLVVGTLLKVLVALSPALGRLNSDQAVLYLTARHVTQGELTPWFWGQQYGGSLLQTALGAVFVLTGPHLWLLPVAIGLLSTLVAVLTWRAGVALGSPPGGAVAGALVAIGPPTWLYFGVASEGFYTVGLSASLGSLVLALSPAPLTGRRAAVIGVLVGLALWASPFSLLTTLPTAAVLVPVLRPNVVHGWSLLLGIVWGALPVITTAVHRGTLLPPQFITRRSIGQRVEDAMTGTWSAVFTRFGPSQVPGWLVQALAVVGLLVAIGIGVLQIVRLRNRRTNLVTLALLLPVVLWVPFHVRSHLPSDAPASRYGLPLLPFLALWVGRRIRTGWLGPMAVAGLALYSAAGLWQAADGLSSGQVLHNRSYALLADDLARHGRTAVYADYWVAYRLSAETDERVTADPPAMSRYRPYALAAARARHTTVVVFMGQANDQALSTRFSGDPGVQRVIVEQFAVYYADRRLTLPGFWGTADLDRP